MKYSNFGSAAIVAAMVLATVVTIGMPATVQAQSTGLIVTVPFNFQVGETLLPPGTYTLYLRAGSAISISGQKGQAASSLTNPVRRPQARNAAESVLVFKVYGDKHFLNEVRWAGYSDARSLIESRLEREIAKASRPARPATEMVAAAAK